MSKDGLKPDPQKTEAICSMDTPKDVAELQRFLEVANYMTKVLPKLSETSLPLRELLASEKWTWGQRQAKAFDILKKKIVAITTLKFFDPQRETTIQCDASSYALGAIKWYRTKVYADREGNPCDLVLLQEVRSIHIRKQARRSSKSRCLTYRREFNE